MKQKSHFFFSGILLGIAIVYLLTRSSYPGFGDSIGFLLFAERGFDLATNATSHFLYTNVNHLALVLFPQANPVSVLVGVSLVFSLFCIIFTYKYIKLISKDTIKTLIPLLIFALSFTWWRQSVIVEVYTFYCFWIITSLYLMLKDILNEQHKYPIPIAALLGLGTLTHIQTILFFPLLGWYFLSVKNISKKSIFFSVIVLILVASPLIVLPLWLKSHNLSAVFFDNQYRGTVLSLNLEDLVKGTLRSLGYLIYNFHIFTIFIIRGIQIAWNENRKLFWFSLIAAGPVWVFAMRYNVSDNYVFFLVPYIILTGLGSLGLKKFGEHIHRKFLPAFILVAFFLSPTIYWTTWKIAEQIESLTVWAAPKTYKGGLKYYLWPGQETSTDPLELAKKIYTGEISPIDDFERYPVAIEYLKEKGEINEN
ncbi:MAG: DUF2723 domain-containing protein [Bacteroidetes bacterium]|nr:DUF2723 domain-containing protein [Bacteroidota bacterium]MCB0842853.1 DUF2723 domain-containing protein [Bacteroidota bacterium]